MKHHRSTGLAILSLLLLLAAGVLLGSYYPPSTHSPPLPGYPWIYLRANKPIGAGERTLELILVGDIFLGRGVPEPAHALENAAPWLNAADLTIGNLEGVVQSNPEPVTISSTGPSGSPILLSMPTSAVEALDHAGFDLLSLANNHALDYGVSGLEGTSAYLGEAGIIPLGVLSEDNLEETIVIKEVQEIRLAFLGINAIPTITDGSKALIFEWDEAAVRQAIQAARSEADAVVVSIHWGYEYQTMIDPAQRQMAEVILGSGADLVIGHHPHVMQGIEIHSNSTQAGIPKTQIVAYSLGNFAFDQQAHGTHRGLALQVWVDKQGIRAARALPISSGPHPRLLPADYARIVLDQLIPPVQACFECDQTACQPVSPPKYQLENPIADHRIDLTGDGLEELIQREAGGITIAEGNRTVWQSPATWQVLDYALGDPNADGRGELLLALQKPDENGVHRSHPFIIGYRNGSYRILWGGSAVSEPILEVDLEDFNTDGAQELVVLEELPGTDLRTISVWRWHGWGFSQTWRSEPGNYQSLEIYYQDSMEAGIICATISNEERE